MQNVLVIYNAFLSKKSPGGQILRPFLMGLDDNLSKIKVVCKKDSTTQFDNLNIQVHQVKESRLIHDVFAIIRRIFSDISFLPDTEYYSWAPAAKRKAIEIINKDKPTYIHSVSLANANHLIALDLKKKYGIPWVAQFYDPWANNYFRPFKTKYFKKKDYALEEKVAREADIILHTSRAMCNDWIERYGDIVRGKIFVLPLSMPPQPPFLAKTYCSEKLSVSHIGNFYNGRTSENFIAAVAEFLKRYPDFRSRLVVNYVGNTTDNDIKAIETHNLNDIFNITGRVSQDECISYYINSDIFLAVDGVGDDNLFFPSKIMKYFYYQKPILGITPSGSVLDLELAQYGCQSIDNYDIEGIITYLKKAFDDYGTLCYFDKDYWKKFTVESVTEEFMKIIGRIK